jgi:predicted nucleic acid-binding protein
VFRILIDTCVWLDLAKDRHQTALLAALEALIRAERVVLIVPSIVVDEFRRNEERIAKESAQSLRAVLKRVKDAVEQHADPKKKKAVLQQLEDVNQKMPVKGGAAEQTLERIGALLSGSDVIGLTDDVLVRAARRAVEKKAPFHRNMNSIGDAIILETFVDAVRDRKPGDRVAFVTHNTKDFSTPQGDVRSPHPDLAALFTKITSPYFTKLGDALRRAEPHLVADVLFEHSFEQEPRGLHEMLEAIDLLFHQVWYNRHQVSRERVESGKIKLVERETFPITDHSRRPIQRDVWAMARKSATRVEKRYGLENLGPWDDFEWGMINGKLSALRWVLGDDWDMLDS